MLQISLVIDIVVLGVCVFLGVGVSFGFIIFWDLSVLFELLGLLGAVFSGLGISGSVFFSLAGM